MNKDSSHLNKQLEQILQQETDETQNVSSFFHRRKEKCSHLFNPAGD